MDATLHDCQFHLESVDEVLALVPSLKFTYSHHLLLMQINISRYFLGTFSSVTSHTSTCTSHPFSKLLAMSNVQYRKMYSNVSKNGITSFPTTTSSWGLSEKSYKVG
ncbi:hypothetical protein H5410_028576 [Solanum commersonii]|uniref:Uncharacterized protein n=1 Tax=Solanum commersonii TaxID=4109 RepID=A0A9J5Z6J4_SOLCO|nr:hypothetical protein H5410_028576 [Solanum commersonii]